MTDGRKELKPYQSIQKSSEPSRLFLSGIHGNESSSTIHALKKFDINQVDKGNLAIYHFSPTPYISTLQRGFFYSPQGEKILKLIFDLKPSIYLELHCYHAAKSNLTNFDRRKIQGVPPLVELEKNVLIGSISPIIRSVYFKEEDFPFILEMPCNLDEESLEVYLKVMNIVATSQNRSEIIKRLKKLYPIAVKTLQKNFIEFLDNFQVLFKKYLNYPEIIPPGDEFIKDITKKSDNLNLNLTPAQIQQVAEAILIFQRRD